MKNQYYERIFTFFVIFSVLLGLLSASSKHARAASIITFTGEELLGKPEANAITINIIPDTTIEYHYQYGTSPGVYTWSTANVTAAGGQPHEVVISGLNSNTQYYYRMQYHAPGDAMDDWVNRSEHSFWTQRAEGSNFTFTVTSDSHATFNTSHQNAMTNISNENPDFNIDLGDTFYVDNTTSQSAVNTKYLAYRNPLYLGKIGPSVPIFLSPGNHENEEGWNFDDTPFSIALGSVQARKAFYPTPITDGFYSGNTDILAAIDATTYGDQLRENYYAWTWGDALFVVIDPFQYTMDLSYTPVAGEGTNDTVTGDQWSWTLGAQQFQWLKQTLENSSAKYKFVFSHQMVGGIPRGPIAGAEAGYVRGGCEAAAYFEWGGKNADGSEGFADHRNEADFGTEPIHQFMIDNGVSAYFHGHDHQYVYEKCDGIVYQEVPSPSMTGSGFAGIYTEGDHGTYNTIKMLPSPGHLRISVTPSLATVDYISSSSTAGTVNYSYTIAPNATVPTHVLTTSVSPSGGGTINPAAGTHTYNEGEIVPITATANPGYTFSSWSGACVGSGACSVTMDADKTVTANFAINTYTLTYTAGTGGTITAPATSPTTHDQGAVVTITAVPNTGYHFVNWTGDVGTVANVNAASTTITMNGNYAITANFAINTYTLTAGNDGNGTVTLSPAGGTYDYGTTVTLIPVPNSGYQFSSWSGANAGDIVNTGGVYTIVMNGNKSINANFAINTYTLTYTAGAGGTITAPATSPTTHDSGAVVTITAAPNTGYHFVNWTGDVSTVGDVNAASTTITMNGNYAITANFAINTYTLTYTAGTGGTITAPATSPTTHDSGAVVTITAAPNTGYHFVNWTGDVGTVANVNAASTTITMNGNYTIVAQFAINIYYIYLPIIQH
jgi:hypothetical protein